MSTITGTTVTSTVTLSTAGSYASPLTVASSGAVKTSGIAIYGPNSQAWAVTNYGTISSANNDGVSLQNGGSVSNSGTALISGGANWAAVAIYNVAGTVTNTGTIKGASGSGVGVFLNAGGSVNNSGTAAVISGYQGISANGPLTVTNLGTISGSGTNDNGIIATGGGSIGNIGSTALISGIYAIFVSGAFTVTNAGTISGLNGTSTSVALLSGGSVGNTGTAALISGGKSGVYIYGGAGTVTNAGAIKATGTAGSGVNLMDGGSVGNTGTAALISGSKYGIKVAGTAGTISNAGTISGGTDAILFASGNDRVIVAPGAVFVGNVQGAGSGNTVELASAASTGTINASQFLDFQRITEDAGASWKLTGSDTSAPITLTSGAYLDNAGTVSLTGGATAITGTGGAISLTNTGTISATTNPGILLADGGSVGNHGLISGGTGGIYGTAGSATLANYGRIVGTGGDGVQFAGSGNDTVLNAGTISGGGGDYALLMGGGVNLLTLDPGAVFVGTVGGGSGDDSTLDLASAASAGTLSGIGTQYRGFSSVVVEPNAKWALGGSNALSGTISSGATLELLAGASATGTISFAAATGTLQLDGSLAADPTPALAAKIIGFAPGDTIDLGGVAFDSGGRVGLGANNLLQVTENGKTYDLQLDPNQNLAGFEFNIAADGGGTGTDVTMTMAAPPPTTPAGTTADLLTQDTQTGAIRLYDLGSNTALATYPIGQIGLEWQLVGLGGFNALDTSDFLCATSATTTSTTSMSRTARSPRPGRSAISARSGRCWGLAISAATPAKPTG